MELGDLREHEKRDRVTRVPAAIDAVPYRHLLAYLRSHGHACLISVHHEHGLRTSKFGTGSMVRKGIVIVR